VTMKEKKSNLFKQLQNIKITLFMKETENVF